VIAISGGCGRGENGLTKVTIVLDWTPNINHTGLYVAQALGYFREAGLEVSIVAPDDNLAPQLVAAGRAQFGISYQEEVTLARAASMDIVSIAAIMQHNTSGFAWTADKNISGVADFAGKTYGGWGGQVERALLDYLIEQSGAGGSVRIIDIGSSDFFAASQANIDFSWVFYGVTGIEAEIREIPIEMLYLTDIDPALDYYTPVIIAKSSWLAANADITERFLQAVSRGYTYAINQPEQAADMLIQAAPGLNRDFIQRGQKWIAGQYQAEAAYWGEQKESVWQNFSQWLTERSLLVAGFDVNAAYTNRYLPKE